MQQAMKTVHVKAAKPKTARFRLQEVLLMVTTLLPKLKNKLET